MDVRSRVMSALRWSAAARLLGQLFSWTITIVVIRLLAPEDYGLMAMAVVLVSFLFGLNTLGLDAVLVQRRDLDALARRQIFGVIVLTNLAFFLLLFFGADSIARFYGAPALAPIVQVLSLQFPLLIFETLPQSRLEREIDFARRSVVDLVTLILGSLATLTLALLDYGVWALVWGMLVNTASRVMGLNLICPSLIRPNFSPRGMARHLAFGGLVSTDRGLWYLFAESDKFIGGKLLGDQALGYFAVASQLATLPIQKLTGLLNAIAFPAFAHTHANVSLAKVRDYMLTATRLLAIVAFPLFLGVACTAESIIAVLLGDKWLPAAPLLQLLGLVMPLRLLSNVFPPLLWGIGTPRTSATNYALAAIAMPLAFYIGARYGVAGLAWAWLGAYPAVFTVIAWRTCRRVGLRFVAYLAALGRPLCAAVAMYAVVLAAGPRLPGAVGEWGHLAAQVVVGGAIYGGIMLLIDRASIRESLRLLRA